MGYLNPPCPPLETSNVLSSSVLYAFFWPWGQPNFTSSWIVCCCVQPAIVQSGAAVHLAEILKHRNSGIVESLLILLNHNRGGKKRGRTFQEDCAWVQNGNIWFVWTGVNVCTVSIVSVVKGMDPCRICLMRALFKMVIWGFLSVFGYIADHPTADVVLRGNLHPSVLLSEAPQLCS